MGQVYRARDTRLGRTVAVKVVDTQFSARFETEARAISALNHPNICTLHDVGPNYLVMEFVEGETLAERLKSGRLAPEEAVRLATAIADALAAAHAKNMAHRDLKPGNVMITPEGRVKLLDFGLAKMLAGKTEDPDATRTVDGAVLGTFAYMSPEQLQGKPSGAASDIFTFGAVLYEMLSGRRAFNTAVLRDDPAPLTSVAPDLAAIVARCLRRNPHERYASMAEVKSALERAGTSPAEATPSIAVLPFANMSADKDNEYFSDGLAEEILNALTRVEGLKVTARTSAFAFRGKEVDIRTIAETLGVRTVLEGSMRRSGNRIRVTAQLVNAADGYQLWSERYDRDMTDVFAVQDEIAAAIVEALKLKLAAAPPKLARPVNIDAYHALLKGRYHMWKQNPEDFARGMAHFDSAVAFDPNYAAAHAALAMGYWLTATSGMNPVREMVPPARAAALKALELDPKQPEAHAVLAIIAASFDYDWKAAVSHFEVARTSADPYILGTCSSMVLAPLGRFEELRQLSETGLDADPLSAAPLTSLVASLMGLGLYARAREEGLRLIELHPHVFVSYLHVSQLEILGGRSAEAIAILERGVVAAPWFPVFLGALAGLYRRTGQDAKADATLLRLESMGGHAVVDVARGQYHVLCSDFERAADCFERVLEARHFVVTQLAWSPVAKEFRKTPRGRALLAKMNLTDLSRV
jgi:serine/threonine-protein kinase